MAGTPGSIRRPLDATEDPTFSLVRASPATTLQAIVTALGARWRIEEDGENSKDMGLDHEEVRSYLGWYRHITLVMLALAFLTSLAIAARTLPTAPVGPFPEPEVSLVPQDLSPLGPASPPAPVPCTFQSPTGLPLVGLAALASAHRQLFPHAPPSQGRLAWLLRLRHPCPQPPGISLGLPGISPGIAGTHTTAALSN